MDWKDIWVEKYRPKTLDDIILSDELKKFLEELKKDSTDTGGLPNLLFSGSAGVGKSSLSRIIAEDILDCQYLYINGSEETSIDTVRTKIIGFAQTKSVDGKIKVIILDEADGLSSSTAMGRSSAQQALKNVIEEYSTNTRFIFTTNNPDKIIEPIHSRLLHFNFDLTKKQCMQKAVEILKKENIEIEKSQIDPLKELVVKNAPDLRNIIIQLQKSCVDGKLDIQVVGESNNLHKEVLDCIFHKDDLMSMREKIIKNQDVLNVDYHDLMKNMFNVLLNDYSEVDQKKKIQMSLIISDSIVDHFNVADKEINFSACMFKLSKVI